LIETECAQRTGAFKIRDAMPDDVPASKVARLLRAFPLYRRGTYQSGRLQAADAVADTNFHTSTDSRALFISSSKGLPRAG
jgi:hypothetical protein